MPPRSPISEYKPSPLRRSFDDDDDTDDTTENDTSFTSESSSAPLLAAADTDCFDEKSGKREELPFARQDLKAKTQEEDERKKGRWRNVKAAAMVLITIVLSSALYYGSFHIPRRAKQVALVAEEAVAQSFGPLLSTTATNASLVEHTADFNLLFPKRPLERGTPSLSSLPVPSDADSPFSLQTATFSSKPFAVPSPSTPPPPSSSTVATPTSHSAPTHTASSSSDRRCSVRRIRSRKRLTIGGLRSSFCSRIRESMRCGRGRSTRLATSSITEKGDLVRYLFLFFNLRREN
jgi:hypothetical protein